MLCRIYSGGNEKKGVLKLYDNAAQIITVPSPKFRLDRTTVV